MEQTYFGIDVQTRRRPAWMALDSLRSRRNHDTRSFSLSTYALREGENHLPVSLNFSTFSPGAKDIIDACIAAFRVAEFENGRGCEAGVDGLGTIVIPHPLPDSVSAKLLQWPG